MRGHRGNGYSDSEFITEFCGKKSINYILTLIQPKGPSSEQYKFRKKNPGMPFSSMAKSKQNRLIFYAVSLISDQEIAILLMLKNLTISPKSS